MKRILITAALAVLASAPIYAETYDGVQTVRSVRSLAEVNEEAGRAAAAPNQNIPRGSRGAEPFTATADRETVSKEAALAARAPDQNVGRGSKYNSVIISTLK